MRCIVIFITALLSSALNIAVGQSVIIGKVTDNSTLEPLHGVYVIYQKNQGTTTDDSGSFFIKTDSGKLTVMFQFIGYKSISRIVKVAPNDTLIMEVGLDMELKEIGHIVVSASKTEQKVAELTVSMDIIKSSEFLKTHINDPQELVNKTPGIEVLDGQASIRGGSGFSYGVGSRVLALIDGLPVVAPDAGNIKWQFLPLENIQQIEIIKGASSVLYGSSALNGIINFRTAEASSIPDTRFFAETGVYGKPRNRDWIWWDTPRVFSTASFSHLQKAGKNDIGLAVNLMTDAGYRKYNDEKLGRISLRIKHRNTNVKGLVYGLNINSGYTAKRDFLLWEDAEYGALKQDTSTISLLHGSFFAVDPYISYNNSGRFRHDFKMRLQSSNNRFPVRDENNSDAYSVYAEYQTFFRLLNTINVTAGVAQNYNNVMSHFYGDHAGVNLAGFTQIEASPVKRVKLVAGVRVEQNRLDGKNDRIVPVFRTGINWQASEYTFLRASFGEGYRYPSIAEKHASTTLGAIKIFPNPFVNPESGWSSEIGIKQGIVIGSTTGQADASIFLSQNEELIEYVFSNYPDPVTGIFDFGFQATNVEQSRIYGYETEVILNRAFRGFATTLTGGYTYIYPVEFNQTTNRDSDKFLKYRRKHSAKISLNNSYKKLDIGLSLFVKSKLLNIDDVFLSELTRESILPGFYEYWLKNNTGYFLMDGNIGYNLNSAFTLSVAIKNITNTEYMGRPGDIQPQRNFSFRLSGNF